MSAADNTQAQQREPLLRLRGITKRFFGTHALRGVDLDVHAGRIHALVGENGAGKSTLGRIMSGAMKPGGGTLELDGRPVRPGSPREALNLGIAAVQQELALVPTLSPAENVFLGVETTRHLAPRMRTLAQRLGALAQDAGVTLPPARRVRDLSLAEQQQVEILRALARDARLIIFDEPTAALTADQAARLHTTMRRLAESGKAVVYVTHFLRHVVEVCDDVSILRDGTLVRTSRVADETVDSMVEGMIGRPSGLLFPSRRGPVAGDPPVLRVRDLRNGARLRDLSFDLHAGEILGLGGLVGSGRSEAARALVGADRGASGEVELAGRSLPIRRPADAIDAGIMMLPESRKDQGLHLGRSVAFNLTLPSLGAVSRLGVVRPRAERQAALAALERIGVAVDRYAAPVRSLSGGNQQKVLLGKWLLRGPRVLLADEPTRGVDVGAKHAIYVLLAELADAGVAVLLISSDLEELVGLSDRLIVLREGRAAAELQRDEMTEAAVMAAAFGTDPTTSMEHAA